MRSESIQKLCGNVTVAKLIIRNIRDTQKAILWMAF